MSIDYKVRVYLASPVFEKVGGAKHPIMLDALLARIALERQGVRKTTAELDPKNIIFADLPIERIGKCYLCSAAFAPSRSYSKADSFAKRGTDAQNIRSFCKEFLGTGAVSIPALVPHIAVAEEYLDFYVRVTDKAEFFSLLKEAKRYGIGPKTSIGFGQIASIHVAEEKEHGNRCFKTEDGFPTRPLPYCDFKGKISDDAATGWSTYYAPYWNSIGKAKCYLPPQKKFSSLMITKNYTQPLYLEFRIHVKTFQEWLLP